MSEHQNWQNFYRELGIDCELSGVVIPNDPGGFTRVIIMTPGITPQRAFALCARAFPTRIPFKVNLDQEVTISDRSARDGAYAIRLRDRIEADEELKDLSPDALKERSIPGIIFEERFILELKFFQETGEHLDIQNITLCSGSRFRNDYVPGVGWLNNELEVRWCRSDCPYAYRRSRQVVF